MSVTILRNPMLAMLLALPIAASGDGGVRDTPAEYSHLLQLAAPAGQAVVPLRLPREVYLDARSPGLNDLRIFDAAGVPMPFALTELAPPAQVSRTSALAAIFPVHGKARDGGAVRDDLRIRTGSDGTVISVTPGAPAAGDTLQGLVLDLQPAIRNVPVGATALVGSLSLSLPPGTGNYNAWVAVDVSNDLQDWQKMTEAAVSWLINEQGASVQKHRIEFEPQAFRYARIRWLEGQPIVFANIEAGFVHERQVVQPLDSIVVQGRSGSDSRDIVYATPIAIPVEKLGLEFQGQNVVMPALVGQYQAVRGREPGARIVQQFKPLVNATFFQLTQNGQRRTSGDIGVPITHAAQWVVRPQSGVSDLPSLRLRWKPVSIVFVAAGKAPYRLAFGRTGARATAIALHQVAPGFSERELAALEVGKPGTLTRQLVTPIVDEGPPPGKTAVGQQRWLWAVLIAAVLVLGGMAWHLIRQLKGAAPTQPPA